MLKKLFIFNLLILLSFNSFSNDIFHDIIKSNLGSKIKVALTTYKNKTIYIKVTNGDATILLDDQKIGINDGEVLRLTSSYQKTFYKNRGYNKISLEKSSILTLFEISKNRKNFNKYRGNFLIINEKGLLIPINKISAEEYLYGVLPGELPNNFPDEAIKAQAVAARTYMYYNLNHSKYKEYDLTDHTNSQVYLGYDRENPIMNKMINETSNEVIKYNGKPIEALFTADAGGYTADPKYIWGKSIPYLKAFSDAGNEIYSSRKNWSYEITLSKLSDIFGFDIDNIKVLDYKNKRAVLILLEGAINKKISGQKLRSIVGYTNIFSTYFKIERNGNKIIFNGHGSGHGLGLSQWGAYAMAKKGEKYKEILLHYYKGVVIGKI